MHIVLIGDSIFDNASYVNDSESVEDLLQQKIPVAKVSLLAVDGDVTTDVLSQLEKFPNDATHVFVSCGGNDALRSIGILEKKSSSIKESLEVLHHAREGFRQNYIAMIEAILKRHKDVSACTIYNNVPGLSEAALTALALFNEVILEELSARRLSIIDLRNICTEESDYSSISPIEPSKYGGIKIVERIETLLVSGKKYSMCV